MQIIESRDAPIFDLPGTRFVGLASPSRGARENAVWRLTVAPGTRSVRHRLTREEIFVVLAGAVDVIEGDRRRRLAAGDALVVPAGTEFGIENPYDEAFEAVAVLPVGGEARIGDEPAFTPPWAA